MTVPICSKVPGAKPLFSIGVRELVDFLLRTGNLGGGGLFAGPDRALEGGKAHRRLQNSRPSTYEAEISLAHDIDTVDFTLRIQGRVDGLVATESALSVEEIKSRIGSLPFEPDPLHEAQGKVYAAILLFQRPQITAAQVLVTYVEIESEIEKTFRSHFTRGELESFLHSLIKAYLPWVENWFAWRQTRTASIQQLPFPFAEYRAGQRHLAKAIYRSISSKSRLLAEAPTGIGKTISALFPAVKALAEDKIEKLFYLTGKTTVRTVAEKGVNDLRKGGLRLRSLTLTARDKICFHDGKSCDTSFCRYAIGYYDRYKAALIDGLSHDELNRQTIEEIARQHEVCPFALSLDLAPWADLIICDYNYVFDPQGYLKQFFSQQKRAFVFLVDEAHNLPDRAREMFSAELGLEEIREARSFDSEVPGGRKLLKRIEKEFQALKEVEREESSRALVDAPVSLLRSIAEFLDLLEEYLAKNEPSIFRTAVLEFYFRMLAFIRTSEFYDERYRTLIFQKSKNVRVRLFCLDPSFLLNLALNRGVAAILFSASLTPRPFFQRMFACSEKDGTLQLESPFPAENLRVLIASQIATDFKSRGKTAELVCEGITAFVSGRIGNYMVYFPSYAYLEEVLNRFCGLNPDITVLVQASGMNELERETFINSFRGNGSETLVGFAVMGGVFGEGIDLVGDRLIGAVVVGVGLPQLCLERNLIRNYFEDLGLAGFDYAYTYPGFIRVLQAVGRVIRTPTDRGAVLLIDSRFRETRYQRLLPAYWASAMVRTSKDISLSLRDFWSEQEGAN